MAESVPTALAANRRQDPYRDSQPRLRSSSQPRNRYPGLSPSSTEPSTARANRSRTSTFSNTLSDVRQSIRSSTDEFVRPRATDFTEESYWQSAPLALALVPAIGGIFFHNGCAVLTDITLLCLAAVLLNWSVRLPWDWYHSAQETVVKHPLVEKPTIEDIPEQKACGPDGDLGEASLAHNENASPQTPPVDPYMTAKARREFHTHESIALASCVICPGIGTWLLHALRSKLSRPSEGLISDCNLTIFLLAAEIRPVAHLLKLVHARTLHLQKLVESTSDNQLRVDANKILDLARRVDKLEADVAEFAPQGIVDQGVSNLPEEGDLERKLCQFNTQARTMKADINALVRAVRKYEKRFTLLTLETDARFDDLESCIRVLNSKLLPESFLFRPVWALPKVVQRALTLPWHVLKNMVLLPILVATWWFALLTRVLGLGAHSNVAGGRG